MDRIYSLVLSLSKIPRWQKRILSIAIDFLALTLLSVFALSIRFGELYWPEYEYWLSIFVLPVIAIPVFIRLGLYRSVVRYISVRFAYVVFWAVALTFIVWAALLFMLDLPFPRSAIVINWLFVLLFITGSRVIARSLLSNELQHSKNIRKRVIIYGAGSAGQQLFNALLKIKSIRIVGFLDDCPQLHSQSIHSIQVYKPEHLQSLVEKYSVTDLFLAIPSLSSSRKRAILKWLEPKPVKVSVLPPIDKIVGGEVEYSDVRDVDVEDLLGRETVPPQEGLLEECVANKVVFVSGAGGSIGSELCRQIVNLKPQKLILYELSELALYQIHKELEMHNIELLAILGSIQDRKKLGKIFEEFDIDTVYHAAAYKHVPLVEHNILEGIKNNSFGTLAVAQIAAEHKVKNFVLISTDKAVRPTNVMGATKRIAEMALQALQDDFIGTKFIMVRFGNVLGSSGSVIPLFKSQIKSGGPVTVTHPDITRFFMTIPEAASLVIQAGSMGTGGDVFVLDMGEPVKIVDLAKRMIRLSGLEVADESGNGDIEIKFTGLRPGEKLYEELLIGDDVDGTEHLKIMKSHEDYLPYEDLKKVYSQLEKAVDCYDYEQVFQVINDTVTGFKHTSGIVDYLNNSALEAKK